MPFKKADLGPYDTDLAANVVSKDHILRGIEKNRTEHPYHYYLNPFVRGPFSRTWHGFGRDVNAGAGTSTLANILSTIGSWPMNPNMLNPAGTLLNAPAGMLGALQPQRAEKLRAEHEKTKKYDVPKNPELYKDQNKKPENETEEKKADAVNQYLSNPPPPNTAPPQNYGALMGGLAGGINANKMLPPAPQGILQGSGASLGGYNIMQKSLQPAKPALPQNNMYQPKQAPQPSMYNKTSSLSEKIAKLAISTRIKTKV